MPLKRQSFATISSIRNTIFSFLDLAADIDDQLKEIVAPSVAFSVDIYENTDIKNIAQVAIFIHHLMQV